MEPTSSPYSQLVTCCRQPPSRTSSTRMDNAAMYCTAGDLAFVAQRTIADEGKSFRLQ